MSERPSKPNANAARKPMAPNAEPHNGRSSSGRLRGKRITLCVTGSVAAYKSVLLLRLLKQEGAELEVVLTHGATQFVGAATFAGLLGRAPHGSMFAEGLAGELHVELAKRSDLLLIAPITADMLARLAQGRADDLATATALCAACPILVAPAMHPRMWSHPATQRNVQTLVGDQRVGFVGPVEGEHAHGGKPDGTDRSAGERDDQTVVPGQRGRPTHGGVPGARAPCAPTGRRARTSPSGRPS